MGKGGVPIHTDGGFEMLGLEEFARRMSICPNTVRNWIKRGKLVEGIHFMHVDTIYRFPWSMEHIDKLMRSLTPEPPPSRPKLQSRRGNRGHLKFRA